MENKNTDTLTRARALHAAEVAHAGAVESLEIALQEALAAEDTERAAQLARNIRDQLLKDVDAHGSIYRLEPEMPTGTNFAAWLPMLRQIAEHLTGPWAAYRRLLLDVPQQPGFPAQIDWPEKPEA